jgi:outer membrane protein assembly factor BamB
LYLGVTSPGLRGSEAKQLWALDTTTWQRVWTARSDTFFFDLASSPDGAVLYLVAPDERRLSAVDAATGKELWRLEGLGQAPAVIRTGTAP